MRGKSWLSGRSTLVLCAALALPFFTQTWQWDDFWHLATGRWITAHHALPHVDPFSFTRQGEPWLLVSWLADVPLYLAHAAGGYAGLAALKVLAAFVVFVLVDRTLEEEGFVGLERAAVLVTVFPFLHLRNTSARPEIFASIFLALTVLVTLRWLRQGGLGLLLLAPLALAWTAMHGSAPLAGVVPAAGLLAGLRARRPRRDLAVALVTLGLIALVFVATPTGKLSLAVAALHTSERSPLSIGLVREWEAPNLFGDGAPFAIVALTAIAGALFAWRSQPLPLFLAAFGFALFLRSGRHVSTSAILAVPALALAARRLRSLMKRPGWAGASLAMASALVVVAQFSLSRPSRTAMHLGGKLEDRSLPTDTLPTIERLPKGRVLNEYAFGGYLLWAGVPGGVFFDGRSLTVYPEEFFRDVYLRAQGDGASGVADRYGITYALASLEGSFGYGLMQSEDWLPLHYGRASIVFVRRAHADRAVQAGIPVLDLVRFLPEGEFLSAWYGPILADEKARSALEIERRAALAYGPESPIFAALEAFFGDTDRRMASVLRAARPALR